MISKDFLKGKRVTVFGLGVNQGGVGTVHFLMRAGAKEVIVTDIKKKEELSPSLEALKKYKNITYVLGAHRPEDFTRTDLVIKNPAIPWNNEYLRLAREKGIPIEMDSSLFFRFCPAPIIGVTGSKGKTTTSTLLAHILKEAHFSVVTAGVSQVGVLSELEKVTPESVVVFELSSWRLSALSTIEKSPRVAVFTNLFPDHQNYYRGMEDYLSDKENIFRFQKEGDTLIANAGNDWVRRAAEGAPAQVLWFSAASSDKALGAWIEDGHVFVRLNGAAKVLMPLERAALIGEHNQENILAAALAALAFGTPLSAVRRGIETFPGIPHRLERVGEVRGVAYYNDSAATIPEAAISALETFGRKRPVIWLGGGSDKKISLDALAAAATRFAKQAILFTGGGSDALVEWLSKNVPDFPVSIVSSMAEALQAAQAAAEPGDTVLLSPGTASFGVFQNEFDRGDQFRAGVQMLS